MKRELYDLAIFDLGNVCIELDVPRCNHYWAELTGREVDFFDGCLDEYDLHCRFERGEMSELEFYREFVAETSLELDFEQWKHGWNAIFPRVVEPTIATMRAMRDAGLRVVLLSNTNETHIRYFEAQYPEVIRLVDRRYYSQLVGMRKPELRIYEHLLRSENVAGNRSVFFDDKEENLEAARRCGIHAVKVNKCSGAWDWWS